MYFMYRIRKGSTFERCELSNRAVTSPRLELGEKHENILFTLPFALLPLPFLLLSGNTRTILQENYVSLGRGRGTIPES